MLEKSGQPIPFMNRSSMSIPPPVLASFADNCQDTSYGHHSDLCKAYMLSVSMYVLDLTACAPDSACWLSTEIQCMCAAPASKKALVNIAGHHIVTQGLLGQRTSNRISFICKRNQVNCQQLPSHFRMAYPCVASPHTCCCGVVCRVINPRLTRHSCYPCLTAAIHASRYDLAFHLSVQDLSPILPGPIAQDAALVALRQAVLQCISDMARRVGDSLHLLEALGGIVGKLPGPNPLTTAVLECVASAAMAVNFFSPKV